MSKLTDTLHAKRLEREARESDEALWTVLGATTSQPGYDGQRPEYRDPKGRTPGEKKSLALRNVNTDRLEWLLDRSLISPNQYEAGRRLQRDFEIGQIVKWSKSVWADGPMGGSDYARRSTLNDSVLDAQHRTWNALKALGQRGALLLRFVLFESKSIAEAARCMGWERKDIGMPPFLIALDALCAHYGLTP